MSSLEKELGRIADSLRVSSNESSMSEKELLSILKGLQLVQRLLSEKSKLVDEELEEAKLKEKSMKDKNREIRKLNSEIKVLRDRKKDISNIKNKDSRRFIESVFKIHNSYQNVELVLAYSIYSSAGSGFFINDKISDKINDYFQLISKKRIMLLDVLYDPEVEHVLKYDEKFHTPEEEVKRVVEKSLEFRTF